MQRASTKRTAKLLRAVSRSFYLSMRVLPPRLRDPIGIAYLLARAADTLTDTLSLPADSRLHLLQTLRSLIDPCPQRLHKPHGVEIPLRFAQGSEAQLLATLPEIILAFESLAHADRLRVAKVLANLIGGMEFDLQRFHRADSGQVMALHTSSELDKYIYLVAGCVGEFWTEMMVAYITPLAHWNIEKMSILAVQYGKALQLTNILRDIPQDLRNGRCYLPANELALMNLKPYMLRESKVSSKAQSIYIKWLRVDLDYYQAAEQYLLAIPRRCPRLRLACLWPMVIGLATLGLLARSPNWLDLSIPRKVSRAWMYKMLLISLLLCASNFLLRTWLYQLRRCIEKTLAKENKRGA